MQDKVQNMESSHSEIFSDLEQLKAQLKAMGGDEAKQSATFAMEQAEFMEEMSVATPLDVKPIQEIYAEAQVEYKDDLHIHDILSKEEIEKAQEKYNLYIQDFNKKYALDAWDYAIATSCGLFAGMLDVFFVSAPPKPTVSYSKKVDGVFNQWVQSAFNKLIPPDLSHHLSLGNTIGPADTSITKRLKGNHKKVMTPFNHRLKGLAHDPLLGVFFGIWDMINGTCTVVHNGTITSYPTIKGAMPDESIFRRIGRMLGHLLSDVNAPAEKSGNRGMGLPAPFMGLLTMFNNIPVRKNFGSSEMSTFGKQIEWMYVNGYDFRQFVVTSIPMMIMEALLRVFYTVKQMSLYNAPFGETIMDTMPLNLNPRFRMMLAMAYGTSSAVNLGKIYVTQNILNASYGAWMGFAWNSFYSFKWALWSKHTKLWDGILESEIKEIEATVDKIEKLGERAMCLPV